MNRTSNVPKNENGLILMGVRGWREGRGEEREGGRVGFPNGLLLERDHRKSEEGETEVKSNAPAF